MCAHKGLFFFYPCIYFKIGSFSFFKAKTIGHGHMDTHAYKYSFKDMINISSQLVENILEEIMLTSIELKIILSRSQIEGGLITVFQIYHGY